MRHFIHTYVVSVESVLRVPQESIFYMVRNCDFCIAEMLHLTHPSRKHLGHDPPSLHSMKQFLN